MSKADVTMPPRRPPLDPAQAVLIARGDDPAAGYTFMQAVAHTAGGPPNRWPATASPVVAAWFAAWADSLPFGPRQNLRRYIWEASHSRGATEQEAARCWLVRDWLVRVRSAIWLHAAGLVAEATQLDNLSLPYEPQDLAANAQRSGGWLTRPQPAGWTDRLALLAAEAGGTERLDPENRNEALVALATTAAGRFCEHAWRTVASALERQGQHRRRQWWAMADATWPTAHGAAQHLLRVGVCAARLDVGRWLLRRPDGRPRTVLDAACDIGINAAGAVAWSAMAGSAIPDGPIWQTNPQDAWIMARDIAGQATSSVRDALDRSAHQFVERLLATTRPGERQ